MNRIINEKLKQTERTLEEEIEISELSQRIAIFNEEIESNQRNYKEVKREMIKRINSLKGLEKKTQSKIIYKDNSLHVEALIGKLNELELQIKNSALTIEEVNKYDFDNKLKRKVFRTEYFIKERANNFKNSEEERLLKFLNQKENMVNELKIFSKCFNSLDEIQKKLLYYSLFKKETSIKIAERLGYANIKITRLKKKSIKDLTNAITKIEFFN